MLSPTLTHRAATDGWWDWQRRSGCQGNLHVRRRKDTPRGWRTDPGTVHSVQPTAHEHKGATRLYCTLYNAAGQWTAPVQQLLKQDLLLDPLCPLDMPNAPFGYGTETNFH